MNKVQAIRRFNKNRSIVCLKQGNACFKCTLFNNAIKLLLKLLYLCQNVYRLTQKAHIRQHRIVNFIRNEKVALPIRNWQHSSHGKENERISLAGRSYLICMPSSGVLYKRVKIGLTHQISLLWFTNQAFREKNLLQKVAWDILFNAAQLQAVLVHIGSLPLAAFIWLKADLLLFKSLMRHPQKRTVS